MLDIKPSIHPGVILREEFTTPLGITQAQLAKELDVGPKTINEIFQEKRGISPLMALKLSAYFGTTPELWMNLQLNYELYTTFSKEKTSLFKIKELKLV